jgi:hypothetical protein
MVTYRLVRPDRNLSRKLVLVARRDMQCDVPVFAMVFIATASIFSHPDAHPRNTTLFDKPLSQQL